MFDCEYCLNFDNRKCIADIPESDKPDISQSKQNAWGCEYFEFNFTDYEDSNPSFDDYVTEFLVQLDAICYLGFTHNKPIKITLPLCKTYLDSQPINPSCQFRNFIFQTCAVQLAWACHPEGDDSFFEFLTSGNIDQEHEEVSNLNMLSICRVLLGMVYCYYQNILFSHWDGEAEERKVIMAKAFEFTELKVGEKIPYEDD